MQKLIRTGLLTLPFCLAACADDEGSRGAGGSGDTTTGTGGSGSTDGGDAGTGDDGGTDTGGGGTGTGSSGTGTGSSGTGTGSSGTGTGTGSSGTGTGSSSGTGTGSSGTGTGSSSGTGTGSSSGTGTGSSSGTGTGSSSGTGTGSSGTGTGSSSGTGTGSSSGTGTGSSSGTGTGSSSGTGTGSSSGTGTGSSSGTGTGSSSGTTTTGGGLEPCETASATVEPIPPRIMLTLDKSGSMYCTPYHWDHDNDCNGLCTAGCTPCIQRWMSLYDVVETMLNTWEADIYFGALLYPNMQATCPLNDCYNCSFTCNVTGPEVGVALNNAATILSTIPARDYPVQGATPLYSGVTTAINYLLNNVDPSLPRAQILIADGDASCNESGTAAATAAENAYNNNGIITYVVGIDPAGGTASTLEDIANSAGGARPGGPPSYYEANDQAELDQAMQDIINSTLSCVVPLDPEPPEPDNVEVWVDGVLVPEVTDCGTENGWMYVNPPPYDEIEFCGTACDDFRGAGLADILYFCTPG